MLTPPETTTMAPRGKRCSRCLCCDAIIVFEGEALCAACDDGTHRRCLNGTTSLSRIRPTVRLKRRGRQRLLDQ